MGSQLTPAMAQTPMTSRELPISTGRRTLLPKVLWTAMLTESSECPGVFLSPGSLEHRESLGSPGYQVSLGPLESSESLVVERGTVSGLRCLHSCLVTAFLPETLASEHTLRRSLPRP